TLPALVSIRKPACPTLVTCTNDLSTNQGKMEQRPSWFRGTTYVAAAADLPLLEAIESTSITTIALGACAGKGL
ncbi:hypothetical protein, partial [Mycolicibacterium porcinum]